MNELAKKCITQSVEYIFQNLGKNHNHETYYFINNSFLNYEIAGMITNGKNSTITKEYNDFCNIVENGHIDYFVEECITGLINYINEYFTEHVLKMLLYSDSDLEPLKIFKNKMSLEKKDKNITALKKSLNGLEDDNLIIKYEDDDLVIIEKSLINEPCRVFVINLSRAVLGKVVMSL